MTCHKEIAMTIDRQQGYHHRAVTTERQACFKCHSDHAGREFELVHWPDGRDAFDHSLADYPLEGRHMTDSCRDCHKAEFVSADFRSEFPDVNASQTFLGLEQRCAACHNDEHHGQFDAACSNCHVFDGWHPAPGFNHDETAYPLTGGHVGAECAKCHPSAHDASTGADFITYAGVATTCASCHSDVHGGKFGTDCQSCHDTSAWRHLAKATFDHSKTGFKLAGMHRNVTCQQCHKNDSKVAATQGDRCANCHTDVHRGQFNKKPYVGHCEQCHDESGFTPALYGVDAHAQSRFPLEGAHLALPCIACHKSVTSAGGAYVVFAFAGISCESCHSTPVNMD